MTSTTGAAQRFRIRRAGILNVWQYDQQVFDFADGRLLLRGTNGAGKSKTMEMLLPFVIDGDTSRLTASGRHHTSLVWLLLDGYAGQARTGYVWVEFQRTGPDGEVETLTCGVGMRATTSARRATSWFFTSPRRVGVDLQLEDAAGPLSQGALAADLERSDAGAGHVFDSARRYREHVGQALFGLALEQYDSLLRLIYWLRQPQVGEDIDPRRLAEQLVNALPVLDAGTVSEAGATFDELEAFGEDLDRRERAAVALIDFLRTYAGYARSVLAERGRAALEASSKVTAARRRVRTSERELEETTGQLRSTGEAITDAEREREDAHARRLALEAGPEAQSRARLVELGRRAEDLRAALLEAERLVGQATEAATRSGALADSGSTAVHQRTQALHRTTAEASSALAGARIRTQPAPTAAVLQAQPVWAAPTDLSSTQERVRQAAGAHSEWASAARSSTGQVKAAVQVVDEARREAAFAQAEARRADEGAEAVQTRVARHRELVTQAQQAVEAVETELTQALATWTADSAAVPLVLPELTREGLGMLESVVADAAAPRQAGIARDLASAEERESGARRLLTELRARREAVEREVDPAPAPPAWRREARDGVAGAPLWRLVDFVPEVTEPDRAGLEAALEGAGLLDAWVTPSGEVRDRSREDVLLLAAGEGVPDIGVSDVGVSDANLDTLLVPDPNAAHLVPSQVVDLVLSAVGLLVDAAAPGSVLAVSARGDWVAGPARGRTGKATAQFIGATARAAERSRRAAALDALITEQEDEQRSAAAAAQGAREQATALRAWLSARPRHDRVLQAWTRDESAREHLAEAEDELRVALDAARVMRERAAARHTELVRLGELHDLPTTADELAARRELVRTGEGLLAEVDRAAGALINELDRWRERAEQARADVDRLAERSSSLEAARAAWQPVQAEREELASTAGAGIVALEARIAELRRAARSAEEQRAARTRAREALLTQQGTLEGRLDAERTTLAQAEPAREAAFEALRALHMVPGLVASAEVGVDPARPPADRDEVRVLVERAAEGQRSSNDVLQAMTGLQAGPASTHEPRLVETGGTFAAVARDDAAGDQPISQLAHVMAAKVAADRVLLTERERDLFETHVLSQLGDALRGVRRQADELVHAMNGQLGSVSTSQGIKVRLRWRLRDDIPADARRAVELLGQPLGALLADERAELREALHRLIELSRSEAPEDSYTEHLARALDYRQWFAFTVQYHRPEVGQWRDLHRKSALSQGEQKVLCYLPLFAAAAAHFTSLAAPHAPRFVLLDDAFPKIDARTHPLLFGLLVDLDLDFVVTSERLWGTHASVPSLAIYEALRNPAQRGIAQFEHRWDGQQLTAVGAE